jgi:superfamily II DNA/RNA helicase
MMLEEEDGGGGAREGSGSGNGVRATVTLPTRELASQVLTHAKRYCGEDECALVVGGASAQVQEDAIRRGARVVIGTPGRLKEFVDKRVFSLATVKIQVLDEIDRLLDGGFEGEIEAVMKPPGTCQTLCFSATISAALSRFLDRKLVPGYVEVHASGLGGSNVGGKVEHLSFATKHTDESIGIAVIDALQHYASARVDGTVGGQAIVFTETKTTAERLRATLSNMLTTVRTL